MKTASQVEKTPYGFKGTPARLIPSGAERDDERRAVSILLAALSSVNEFAKVMFESVGQRVGTRTQVQAWTEVVFPEKDARPPKDDKRRIDGAIVLKTSKREWKVLVEAKTNKNELGDKQISEYLRIAREQDDQFDALITVSNQFAALPTHHPVSISGRLTRSVKLYHWSWTYLLTQAELLLETDAIADGSQKYILEQVVAYFNGAKSGVIGFTQMNSEWGQILRNCGSKVKLSKDAPEVVNTVASWHQEQRELCLKLWPLVKTRVQIKLPRTHQKSPKVRLEEDCQLLCSDKVLRTVIDVPHAAAPIEVTVHLDSKKVHCDMKLNAPVVEKSTKRRVNWLIKQIPEFKDIEGLSFSVLSMRRGANTTEKNLEELRLYPIAVDDGVNSNMPPTSFVIRMTVDNNRAFSGPQKFVELIEDVVPKYYDLVGQHLRAAVTPAPKIEPVVTGKPPEI